MIEVKVEVEDIKVEDVKVEIVQLFLNYNKLIFFFIFQTLLTYILLE